MKLIIKPFGVVSVDIVKEYADGRLSHTTAIRYPNGIIAYDHPFLLTEKDRKEVRKWYRDNR